MPESTTAFRIDDLDLFADCTKAQLRRIGSLTSYLHIPKDHVLIREGSVGREFIVIRSGSARVTRKTDDGIAQVAEVGTGDFLGEMALLSGTRRTATATAITDLEVLVSSVGEFRSILAIAPSVAHKVHRVSLDRASNLVTAA
ncbi:MAG: cyclic nucleotide-binding domain-containing protein [Acidimicrobiales bacterium]|jgi:CRP-like cAMP-binding protein